MSRYKVMFMHLHLYVHLRLTTHSLYSTFVISNVAVKVVPSSF